MDSRSSGSNRPPTPSAGPARRGLPGSDEAGAGGREDVVVIVAGFHDGVAADFAAFVSQGARSEAILVGDEGSSPRRRKDPCALAGRVLRSNA